MSVYKRKDLQGGHPCRAVVRIKGYPTISGSFVRKQESLDWENETKKQINSGQFHFDQHKKQHTFNELVERYIAGGELEHHRSAKDTVRHLKYWQDRFGSYALIHLTSELIAQERQHLLNTPTTKSKKRSSATVNRYFASHSSCLSFASR